MPLAMARRLPSCWRGKAPLSKAPILIRRRVPTRLSPYAMLAVRHGAAALMPPISLLLKNGLMIVLRNMAALIFWSIMSANLNLVARYQWMRKHGRRKSRSIWIRRFLPCRLCCLLWLTLKLVASLIFRQLPANAILASRRLAMPLPRLD